MSASTKVPVLVPADVGVKVSSTTQFPDADTGLEVEQVVVEVAMAKGPVVVIEVKVRLAFPLLVTVTGSWGLAVPIGSDGKVGAADKLTTAPNPIPVKLRV